MKVNEKLGPLKLWQWLAIGGALGVGWYLYKKSKASSTGEVNPEAEEKLLAALGAQQGGGGEGAGGGNTGVAAPMGPTGEVGGQGVPGIAGPAGETFNAQPIESRLQSVEHQLATNNPPSISHNTAAQGTGAGLVRNPANGEMYRSIKLNGKTYHEYPGRTGPDKRILVGAKPHNKPTGHAAKPKPAKRPKPHPIAHRVTVHKKPKPKHKHK
jgi:hypothetical protein